MRTLPKSPRPTSARRCTVWHRLLVNDRGTAAIEFVLLAPPLLMLTLGLLGYGLYFMTQSSLDYGAEAASRKIRTGQVNSSGTSRPDKQLTVAEFKRLVCQAAGAGINCNNLSVMIDKQATWSQIAAPSCSTRAGDLVNSSGSPNDVVSKYSGAAGDVVLVTLCYRWDLASTFSFLKLPAIMRANAAFKSEPYS